MLSLRFYLDDASLAQARVIKAALIMLSEFRLIIKINSYSEITNYLIVIVR